MIGATVSSAMSHILFRTRFCRNESSRNPQLAVLSVVQDIAGGSVPIFRISPIERGGRFVRAGGLPMALDRRTRRVRAITSSTPARA